MGKKIDRAALHALAALGLYLGFVSAFGSIWLAAACALCTLLLLRKLLSPLAGRLPKREARRGRARAEVERWALLDKDAAEAEARALLEKAYPGQAAEAEMLFLPRHPQGPPLNLNAVLDAWRGRGGEKLLLITTARGGRGGARLRGKAGASGRAPHRRGAALRAARGLSAAQAGRSAGAAALAHRRFP